MSLNNVVRYGMVSAGLILMTFLGFSLYKQNQFEAISQRSMLSDALNLSAKSLYADGLQLGQATRNVLLDYKNERAYQNYIDAEKSFGKNFSNIKGQVAELKAEVFFLDNLNKIEILFTQDMVVHKEIHQLAKSEKSQEAKDLLNNMQTPLWREYRQIIVGLSTKANELAVQARTDATFAQKTLKFIWMIMAVAIIFLPSLVFVLSNRAMNKLRNEMVRLKSEIGETLKSSELLQETSSQMAERANEQASALEETSASINQISTMIDKNVDNAKQSRELAMRAQKSVEQGRTSVEALLETLNKISQGEHEMLEAVEENNSEIVSISNLINEIADKTKVINDIVFQTKLLSFNASVEAARAGEHGRGFAVVAQEIGNLAQMSGRSATDISLILNTSTERVKEIVNRVRQKMNELMVAGKLRNEEANSMAKACSNVLNQIVADVRLVGDTVTEITTASEEQSKGVHEVASVIVEMEAVTNQNSNSAEETSKSADKMREQAESIKGVVSSVGSIIDGDAA